MEATAPEPSVERPPETGGWLNRSTVGVALASLFSDVSHELGTAVLPAVLISIGAGPASLGIVEGSSDGLSAFAKLWGGVMTDRVARRKPLASVGYLVTAVGMAAIGFCERAWQVLLCRTGAWIGRGSRSAPRDFLMAQSVHPLARGKAFGMERASDALGAVIGPLVALALMRSGVQPRHIMIGSLLPGLLAFLSIAFLVTEHSRPKVAGAFGLRASLAATGRPFRRYLSGILVFGSGDFSRTLLILYATQHLSGSLLSLQGASLAIGLYVLHNAVSSAAAFPIGVIADRTGRSRLLVIGYVFAAVTTASFALLAPTPWRLVLLFAASGLYIACEEVVEKAFAVDLLPTETRGTGMGLLAAVNGVGDMASSALVGGLWAVFPANPGVGFIAAAALQLVGAGIIGTAPGVSRTDGEP